MNELESESLPKKKKRLQRKRKKLKKYDLLVLKKLWAICKFNLVNFQERNNAYVQQIWEAAAKAEKEKAAKQKKEEEEKRAKQAAIEVEKKCKAEVTARYQAAIKESKITTEMKTKLVSFW